MLEYLTQQDAVNTILAISGALLAYWGLIRYSLGCGVSPRGCRRLGLPPCQSNIHDEYDPQWSQGGPAKSIDEQGCPAWRIMALFAYPIKSCAGIELNNADVVSTGLAFDRQFCFAEATPEKDSSGDNTSTIWTARTLRDRDFNRMTLVRPEIWLPDPSAADYAPGLDEVKSNGVLAIYYPRVGRNAIHSFFLKLGIYFSLFPREKSFRIPLFPPLDEENNCPTTPVKIWKDTPLAYDYGSHIPESLHRFLSSSRERGRGQEHGRRLTLLRVSPHHHRQIFRNAPRKENLGFQPITGFADAYPLHLLNLSSVRDVASRCRVAIPQLSIRRFRANIIIQGPMAFAEDAWKVIRISHKSSSIDRGADEDEDGSTLIHTVCRTIRCRLPNVDPDTGIRHPSEPDKTLKSYRRIDKGDLTNACLGMQGVPSVQEFRIHVGDAVSVVEMGEHYYIKMLAPGEKIPGV